MLKLYTHPMSRGRMVRWMLEEIGESYETDYLDYATTMKAPVGPPICGLPSSKPSGTPTSSSRRATPSSPAWPKPSEPPAIRNS